MKEAPGSSETSVLTRATRRNKREDTILHVKFARFKIVPNLLLKFIKPLIRGGSLNHSK
jgi:hypothetical protein